MDTLLRDLRYALRTLAKAPGLTAAAIVTLALGIGANASVFSVINSVLLQPLPFAQPERIVMVWNHWTGWPRTWLSESEVADYRDKSGVFARFAPFDDGAVILTGDGQPERLRVGLISADVLPVLGVTPTLGRNFSAEEDRPNGTAAVILGNGLWRRRYGGARDILGRRVIVSGTARTVVGVMPAGFRMPLDFAGESADIYVPLALGPADPSNRGSHYLNAVARLGSGLPLPQAQARLNTFVERMKRETGAYDPYFGATLVPVREQVFGAVRPAVGLVGGAVAFVLLLACVNVASLLLMRGEGRQRELAIRRALGARGADLARQGLAESFILSLAGAAAGLVLAAWAVELLPRLSPASLPRVADVRIDARVLAFTALVSLVTTVLCGLFPVWRAARGDPRSALGEGARGSSGRGASGFRRTVIGVELALAVLLCVGAGLLLRSFVRLTAVRPGFEPAHVLTFRLGIPDGTYPTISGSQAFAARVLERVRALPGVVAAGATNSMPLASTPGDWNFLIGGQTEPPPGSHDVYPVADWIVATPGYAEAMGMRVVAGRWIGPGDTRGAPPVVVLDQTAAQRYWKDKSPIGDRIRLGGQADSVPREVIGVVADVRQNGLDAALRAHMYLPHAQFPSTMPDSTGASVRGLTVAVRSNRRPGDLAPDIRRALQEVDPDVPMAQVRTAGEVVRASTATPRFALAMVGAFALLALALAGIGVYSVIAYVVSTRTREIGVRVALGAQAHDVLRLVIGQGMGPALAGIAAGLAGAFAARGFVRALLYEVPATDAAAFLGAAALLGLVGLVACWFPALRASRVQPMHALREE